MTRRTTTATRSRSNSASARATTRARHELDEVLIDQSKTRMKGSAAPLLGAISQAEKAAVKGIAKREKFLDGVDDLKNAVRTAYDEGDESALKGIQKQLEVYQLSLLRPSRRNKK